jgi:polysaccharide biosynthesis protein capD
VQTQSDEAYTSHNTTRLDIDGIVEKLKTTDYVKEAFGIEK